MGRPKKEKTRKERFYSKVIYLPKERVEEFKRMAEKDGTTKQEKTLASFIQRNVGNFWQVEQIVKDALFQVEAAKKKEGYKASKKEALFQLYEIAAFIEALKTKA